MPPKCRNSSAFVQPDLFGEHDTRQAETLRRVAERAAWEAQFERAPWVAPHDTAGGMKAGDSKPGWRCPVCGEVEPNEFWLGLNHGWDPSVPGRRPWHGYCHRSVPHFAWEFGDPDWELDGEAVTCVA